MKINLVTTKHILENNEIEAQKNRVLFKEAGVIAINLISSPGSGKTTLLEKTLPALSSKQKSIVIVGDLSTNRDAERLCPSAQHVTQINTGMSCHLYANQISTSIKDFNLKGIDYVFIENVGNMVCPGEFDLGENLKIVLLSLPEGDDKVAKYPTIFRVADLVLLTKFDLKDILDFNIKRVEDDLAKLNSKVKIIQISSKTNQGMGEWLNWLKDQRLKKIGNKAGFIKDE